MLLETDQIRDPRLLRRLNLICSQMVVHQSAIVNQFSKEHKEKMGAYRFLNNSSVSSDAILSGLIQTCCKNASGRKHLLCIQDTSEINYEAHVERMKKKQPVPALSVKSNVVLFASCLGSGCLQSYSYRLFFG